jgi:hypothetical protein
MKTLLPILAVTGFVGAGCGAAGHWSGPGHQPTAEDAAPAVRAGSDQIGWPANMRPSCRRTDSGTSVGFGYESFDCDGAIHCDVEWGVEIAGRPTDFYSCERPTGDSFSYDDVCVVGSRGRIAVDAARTAAIGGPEWPCPYRSEDR